MIAGKRDESQLFLIVEPGWKQSPSAMKSTLLDLIRTELRSRFGVLSKAAIEAHSAATDPSSKAEGKYDTRSLEASYLATGQARAVDELAEAIRIFDALGLPDFDIEDPVEAGALVEVESDEGPAFYLLVPASGGLEIHHDGMEITLLTPSSRLYQGMLGQRVGDSVNESGVWIAGIS